MRKSLALVLALFLIAPTTYASTANIPEGMGAKAIRGGINLVTGVVELPMQIYKGYTNGFKPISNTAGSKTVGTILGFFRGMGHAGGRMVLGAWELYVFWTANPENNEVVGIPLDAQYAWEMGTQYNMFEPSFAEGVKPIGRKLVHGLGNSLLGIAEVPAQTKKGISDGNALKGLGRGFWFWWSREMYGFGDIYTSLVPNPVDNPGYPFNSEWPWSNLVS